MIIQSFSDSSILHPSTFRLRRAFTLVEMMVAMTLTIFVMVILSQCFVQGLETFSGLKAVGDMQEELRTATTLLRADLSMDHFEGKRRLSDPAASFINEKIREGFFAIGQGIPPFNTKQKSEGAEDGITSWHATDHWLHFSVKMRGNAPDKFFSASVPAGSPLLTLATNYMGAPGDTLFQGNNSINSAWAEVAYFLVPTGSTLNPGLLPTPSDTSTHLFALYRCQYVVLPMTSAANSAHLPAALYTNFAGTSVSGIMSFSSPNDLAQGYPARTFEPYFPSSFSSNTLPRGAALVLSNVVSFQVQVFKNPSTTPANPDFEDLNLFASGPNPKHQPFDTADYQNGPLLPANYGGPNVRPTTPNFNIQALRIIIRIWDPKSRQTRQVTMIQDM